MTLRSQRRLAASLLRAGLSRIWIDPEEADKVRSAITRAEIQTLVKEGRIRLLPKKGVSRGRVRARAGRRKRSGSKKGGRGPGKRQWVLKIRAVRRHLRTLRDRRQLSPENYRMLLGMAKGGTFQSKSHIDEYVKARQMLRKR
ncbi:MAG TPA: 50S ribosomal protein L19e [Candidatus Bathyarchaeia archaeon]|nr:50S ribosomal protein L19e [Candidatus Bathyarchaeia archaeon]